MNTLAHLMNGTPDETPQMRACRLAWLARLVDSRRKDGQSAPDDAPKHARVTDRGLV